MVEGDIIRRCEERGLRITEQRRVVARALEESEGHPDADELYRRAFDIDPKISLATVYRTVKLFEEAGIVEVRDFRDGRARYEDADRDHHDHLIDLQSGEVIEFLDEEIERLQRRVAAKLGYRLMDHRLELFAVPLTDKEREALARGEEPPSPSQTLPESRTGPKVAKAGDESEPEKAASGRPDPEETVSGKTDADTSDPTMNDRDA